MPANFHPLWARADSYVTDLTLPILPVEEIKVAVRRVSTHISPSKKDDLD